MATFILSLNLHLEFTALHNLDRLLGLVAGVLGNVLDLVDDVVSFKDLAKDNVTTIKPTISGVC